MLSRARSTAASRGRWRRGRWCCCATSRSTAVRYCPLPRSGWRGSRWWATWPTYPTPVTTARPTSGHPGWSHRWPGCGTRCPGASSPTPTAPISGPPKRTPQPPTPRSWSSATPHRTRASTWGRSIRNWPPCTRRRTTRTHSTTSPKGSRPPVPSDEADLPPFDKSATTATYDRWHGQRLLDRDGTAAAYPLGFGLSYTSFVLADVQAALDRDSATIAVRATVENTGTRPGGHVVQAYASRTPPESAGVERFLVGFARVDGSPGERMPVRVDIPLRRLATRRGPGEWTVPPGTYRIDIGANATDPASASVAIAIP